MSLYHRRTWFNVVIIRQHYIDVFVCLYTICQFAHECLSYMLATTPKWVPEVEVNYDDQAAQYVAFVL